MLYVQGNLPINLLRGKKVAVLALGRGVDENGELYEYTKERVTQTVRIVEEVAKYCESVTVVWTGGHSIAQVLSDSVPHRSEGEAMHDYALQYPIPTNVVYKTETSSRSTVENMTNSSTFVTESEILIVVSDRLHFLGGRIRLLMWLTFPAKQALLVAVSSDPSTSWKSYVIHFSTFFLTAFFMIGVPRGNIRGINHRQSALEATVKKVGDIFRFRFFKKEQ
jgi:hypothetical protein